MKVLHYIKTFSQPSESFVYDQIVNLEKKGVDNYILTQKRELADERPFDEAKIYVVKERKRHLMERVLHKIFYWRKYNLRNPKDFVRAIKEINPDVIHAHFGNNGVFIKKLLKKYDLKVPLVISFHGTDITSKPVLDFTYRQEIKNLKSYPELIFTTQTEFLKGKMVSFDIPEQKIKKINNTFNRGFSEMRKEEFFEFGDTLKIINISRFINWKGQKYLLQAFAKLVNNLYENAELTLVGDGERRKEMEGFAEEIGIKSKVTFLGFVEHKKIPEILRKHDVYVQPSIKDEKTHQEESFGVVILEAIAVGLPVIVTDTGGMSETIVKEDEQFSFVVPQKDPDSLYEVFEKMLSNKYEFKDNRDYAERVMEEYSTEKQISSTVEIYKSLTK